MASNRCLTPNYEVPTQDHHIEGDTAQSVSHVIKCNVNRDYQG